MNIIQTVKEKIDNKDDKQKDYHVDYRYNDPVSADAIKDTLALIKVAHESCSEFDVTLTLKIGLFKVTSDSFNDIKLLKETKNEPARIIVSYSNVLLANDTTIKVEDITHIDFNLKYSSNNAEEEDENVQS